MIKIGERFNEEESGMPTLEVLNDKDNSKCYLHPFRGYKFQVSGSPQGSGDYGSTEVVGLANIYSSLIHVKGSHSPACQSNVSGKYMVGEIFYCMAITALTKHAGRDGVAIQGYDANEKIRKFAMDCVEYISKYC